MPDELTPPHDPAQAPPLPGGALCDFCAAEPPTVYFPQKYGFTMILGDGIARRFADPWNACPPCARLVQRGQLHLLLERVMLRHPLYHQMNRPERRAHRAVLKKMYRAMYQSLLGEPLPLHGPQ